ncbi:aminotransferase class V-fold PLP-dependent enzyme [Spirosoma liriopis]|uniref:aminotransferase class V-fold PLP-dependent enzyme n=1 Tax=Spirosoma liriopis TaxID=2937440 RepID=UPI0021D41922|nr:aminotransferase class V-fold PLP-dependent enzyme [Spirosoma liriopis]
MYQIDCESNKVVFTAAATEAINLGIKGCVENQPDQKRHIVTVETEPAAVLDVCLYLETHGYEVTYLPVDRDGLIDLNDICSTLRPDTALVAVMMVNNET